MTNEMWAVFVKYDGTEVIDYEEVDTEKEAEALYQKRQEDVTDGIYDDYEFIEIIKAKIYKYLEMSIPTREEIIFEDDE